MSASQIIDREMGISEFSQELGISLVTLRDWNKRGVSRFLGTPDERGHHRYFFSDLLAIEIAKRVNVSLRWKDAIHIGAVIADHFIRIYNKTNSGEQASQRPFIGFFLQDVGDDWLIYKAVEDVSGLVDIDAVNGVLMFNLHREYLHLPEHLRNALDAIAE